MTDTDPGLSHVTVQPAPPAPTFHAVIGPLPEWLPGDDDRADQPPAWRHGYAAGWAARARSENQPPDGPIGGQRLDQRRLTWALADAVAGMHPLDTAPPLPDLAPPGLVAVCPDPPAQLRDVWWLGWEYAHAADLPHLVAALRAAATDPDAAELAGEHLAPMPRQPDLAGVDVRPRVRFAAYAARAWWSAWPHLDRADDVARLALTDPNAPAHLNARARVLAAADARSHAARFASADETLTAATRCTRWKRADGVGELPWECLRQLDVIAGQWAR